MKSVENNLLTCKWYTGLSDGPLVKKWLFWFGRFGEAVTVGLLVSVFFVNEYFVPLNRHMEQYRLGR